jgi:hypothetical protein
MWTDVSYFLPAILFVLSVVTPAYPQDAGVLSSAPNPHIETIDLTRSISSQLSRVNAFTEAVEGCGDCVMAMVYDFKPKVSTDLQLRRLAQLQNKIWIGCGLAHDRFHRYPNVKGKRGTARLYVLPRGSIPPDE